MLGQFLRIPWNFEIFHEVWTRSEGQPYRSNPLRVSAIGLKFSGMMHNTMKQIAAQNGHAQPIFVRFTEFGNFP